MRYGLRLRFKCDQLPFATFFKTYIRCYTQPNEQGDCSCALDDNCAEPMKFYSRSNLRRGKLIFIVPKLFSGCSIIQSVRLSSLTCFFNLSCLNKIMKLLSRDAVLSMATPLFVSNVSQYSANTSMGTAIDELMVDRWNEHIEYNDYYDQCKPRQCSYTTSTRGNLFYIFSTIVAILGGLSITLKIFSNIIVTAVRNRMRLRTENTDIAGK